MKKKSQSMNSHEITRKNSVLISCAFVDRKLIIRFTLQERIALEGLRSTIIADGEGRAFVHRNAGILALCVDDVKVYAKVW